MSWLFQLQEALDWLIQKKKAFNSTLNGVFQELTVLTNENLLSLEFYVMSSLSLFKPDTTK